MPMSVTTPSFAAPSERTNCTGSAASCGTVKGSTSMPPMGARSPERRKSVRTPSCILPAARNARSVPCVSTTSTLCAAAKSNTQPAWSSCSWVTRIASMSAGSRPRRARRRSVSVRLRPQSMSTRVRSACATRQLPPLPLASEAKRSNLLQLLVEQRKDALRGLRAVGGAILVEHVHLARGSRLCDLHAILLRLHLRIAREPAREEPPRVLLDLGIGVAHEVDALLPIAVLDGETDAVERESHAAPHPVEGLGHLQRLEAVHALADLGALRLLYLDEEAVLLPEVTHQRPELLGLLVDHQPALRAGALDAHALGLRQHHRPQRAGLLLAALGLVARERGGRGARFGHDIAVVARGRRQIGRDLERRHAARLLVLDLALEPLVDARAATEQ